MTAGRLRYIEAVRHGLRSSMLSDPGVIVLGEDVRYGGPFGATKGLADEFGKDRILDTPISEATVMGMATGAAATGLRPVVEIMFVDFATLAMDQLVNHAAKLGFMTGGLLRVPLTVRVQGGVSGRFGAHHSQSLEAWFLHTPGLKVVAPAFPGDAKTLLETAIADDNPVVYVEHRGLYWKKGEVTGDEPSSGSVVRRRGDHVTVVSYSRMVHHALAAAGTLAADGIECEVIDLRWLAPLDLAPVVASLNRTGRAVVAHEAVTSGGVGAEVVARLQAAPGVHPAAPIARVGAPFAPVGAAPELEDAFAPGSGDIVRAVRGLLGEAPPATDRQKGVRT